jgi:exosortase K
VKPSQLAGLGLAVALVIAGKQAIREASAEELGWLLGPTATCVSVLTGSHFVREAGVGYIDRSITFEIAPVCAGVHFMLAAVLALALGWSRYMQTWRTMALRLVAVVGVAYLATIVINTLRIVIAIAMHAHDLGGSELHRLEGVVVYLGGLCALYAIATGRARTAAGGAPAHA